MASQMNKHPARFSGIQRYLYKVSRVSILVIYVHELTHILTGQPALNRMMKPRATHVKLDEIGVNINFRSRPDAVLRIIQRKARFPRSEKFAIGVTEKLHVATTDRPWRNRGLPRPGRALLFNLINHRGERH